jgi:DNA polymerase-3 subunit delta
LLATYVGANLRQLDNELEKLSLYVGQRPITVEDVNLMVSDASEAMVWNLTDALSQRNPAKAMQSLQALRRGDAHPIYLLTMIARQYRVILKVKEAMRTNAGANEFDLSKVVRESPYPVKKAMQQAGSYSFSELIELMDRLVVADNAMKTGADAETEIDLLIAELTQKAPARSAR